MIRTQNKKYETLVVNTNLTEPWLSEGFKHEIQSRGWTIVYRYSKENRLKGVLDFINIGYQFIDISMVLLPQVTEADGNNLEFYFNGLLFETIKTDQPKLMIVLNVISRHIGRIEF